MDIQWYPGHMAKAKRQMEEDIRLVNLIIEMIDARIPFSGRNPDIREMGRQKARIIVLSKADLADEACSRAWTDYYRSTGAETVAADTRRKNIRRDIRPSIDRACHEVMERNRRRGIINRPVRAMVTGIPNVGKSTFINSLAGRSVTKTGNRPGVTKGKQWIHISRELDLLDTPGILWPRVGDPEAGIRLALTGAVNDNILEPEELSLKLIEFLIREYPGSLEKRYSTEAVRIDEKSAPSEIMEAVGRARKCITKGGEISFAKTAGILLDEFRSGTLGRITLDRKRPV